MKLFRCPNCARDGKRELANVKTTEETVFIVTSLSQEQASGARLAALVRRHDLAPRRRAHTLPQLQRHVAKSLCAAVAAVTTNWK